MDNKTVERIPRGEQGEIKITLKADSIKITERHKNNKAKKAKKVSIKLSKEEVEKIYEFFKREELANAFSQRIDPWYFDIEERQV